MNIRKILAAWTAAATLILGAGAVFAEPYPEPDQKSERAERESDLYEEGTDSIDDEEWDDAIRKFKAVAEMKGSRADGALYWMSYALKKAGRRSEALQAIEGLKKNYPSSRWLDDARPAASPSGRSAWRTTI
jgi:outer membrane protein assembly factor BamD (BamD/ComL family)